MLRAPATKRCAAAVCGGLVGVSFCLASVLYGEPADPMPEVARGSTPRVTFGDSGIEGPPYATIEGGLTALAVQHPDLVTNVLYGRSVEGRPLRMIEIRRASRASGTSDGTPPIVIMSGAVHGNEFLGIEDRLPQALVQDGLAAGTGVAKFLDAGGILWMAPVLNPDGYERATRGNANGVDLNRDWDLLPTGEKNFREPESANLAAFVEEGLRRTGGKVVMSMDYHCCATSLLFPWSWTRDELPPRDEIGHEMIARGLQRFLGAEYSFGPTGKILGYLPHGTSKDWFYAKLGALAFTFEGTWSEEIRNFDKHRSWWNWMLESFVGRDAEQSATSFAKPVRRLAAN